MTNIDKHIKFIRKRKENNPTHYVQIIRLVKYWVKEIKKNNDNFKFKSFLIELIVAYLSDNKKIDWDNYIEALAGFFQFSWSGQWFRQKHHIFLITIILK